MASWRHMDRTKSTLFTENSLHAAPKPECSFSGFRDYPFFTFIPKGRAISTLADMWLKPKAAISANSMGVTLIQALASQPPWIYWRAPRFTHTGKRKISTFYIYWFLSVAYWVVSGFLPTFLATHRSYEFFSSDFMLFIYRDKTNNAMCSP
jgi:hypothetical protein